MRTSIKNLKRIVREALEPKSFVASIKLQMNRVRDDEDLRHIADAYDAIIGALMLPEHKQDEWAMRQDPFTKWHFRQARKELKAGTLDLDDVPTGSELFDEEERHREETRVSRRASSVHKVKSPEERAHDQKMNVYGGEANYRAGVGLGT